MFVATEQKKSEQDRTWRARWRQQIYIFRFDSCWSVVYFVECARMAQNGHNFFRTFLKWVFCYILLSILVGIYIEMAFCAEKWSTLRILFTLWLFCSRCCCCFFSSSSSSSVCIALVTCSASCRNKWIPCKFVLTNTCCQRIKNYPLNGDELFQINRELNVVTITLAMTFRMEEKKRKKNSDEMAQVMRICRQFTRAFHSRVECAVSVSLISFMAVKFVSVFSLHLFISLTCRWSKWSHFIRKRERECSWRVGVGSTEKTVRLSFFFRL